METETGMFVLAVQRGARWTYRPRAGFVLHGRRPTDLGRPRGGRGRAPGALQRRPAGRRGALMDAYVYLAGDARQGAVRADAARRTRRPPEGPRGRRQLGRARPDRRAGPGSDRRHGPVAAPWGRRGDPHADDPRRPRRPRGCGRVRQRAGAAHRRGGLLRPRAGAGRCRGRARRARVGDAGRGGRRRPRAAIGIC